MNAPLNLTHAPGMYRLSMGVSNVAIIDSAQVRCDHMLAILELLTGSDGIEPNHLQSLHYSLLSMAEEVRELLGETERRAIGQGQELPGNAVRVLIEGMASQTPEVCEALLDRFLASYEGMRGTENRQQIRRDLAAQLSAIADGVIAPLPEPR